MHLDIYILKLIWFILYIYFEFIPRTEMNLDMSQMLLRG